MSLIADFWEDSNYSIVYSITDRVLFIRDFRAIDNYLKEFFDPSVKIIFVAD